jgi:glycerophosphoryl diester phosphodiesterase
VTQIIAHRGDSSAAPENTLAAIRSALAVGVDLIEIDVRRSRDGVLVLMHDRSVGRTTDGSGAVESLDWQTISMLNASGGGNTFEAVPSLRQALEVIVKSSARLVVEVKHPSHYTGIAGDLLRDLDETHTRARVIVTSFDVEWLRQLRTRAPDVAIGELWIWPPPARRREPTIVSVYWTSVLFDPTLLRRLHRGGHQVWAWTVERTLPMRLLAAVGVDGIITSRPSRCQRVLNGKAGGYTRGSG